MPHVIHTHTPHPPQFLCLERGHTPRRGSSHGDACCSSDRMPAGRAAPLVTTAPRASAPSLASSRDRQTDRQTLPPFSLAGAGLQLFICSPSLVPLSSPTSQAVQTPGWGTEGFTALPASPARCRGCCRSGLGCRTPTACAQPPGSCGGTGKSVRCGEKGVHTHPPPRRRLYHPGARGDTHTPLPEKVIATWTGSWSARWRRRKHPSPRGGCRPR